MIKSLQSLRFLMAMMIFHHHFFMNPQVVQFGTFPVAFFFILSGFVMSIGYAEKALSDEFNYKHFIAKRLMKLLPLNVLCLGLWLILPLMSDFVNGRFSYSTYILLIPDSFLVQAWIPIKEVYFSGNAVAWFLSDMFFCYLFFPYLIKMLTKRWGKILMIIIVATYLLLVQMIEGDYIHSLVYISPFFRVIDFMIGILLCLMLPVLKKDRKPVMGSFLETTAISITILSLLAFSLVPWNYSAASFYWIPSIILILAFALSAKWGGYFLMFSTNHSLYISERLVFRFIWFTK